MFVCYDLVVRQRRFLIYFIFTFTDPAARTPELSSSDSTRSLSGMEKSMRRSDTNVCKHKSVQQIMKDAIVLAKQHTVSTPSLLDADVDDLDEYDTSAFPSMIDFDGDPYEFPADVNVKAISKTRAKANPLSPSTSQMQLSGLHKTINSKEPHSTLANQIDYFKNEFDMDVDVDMFNGIVGDEVSISEAAHLQRNNKTSVTAATTANAGSTSYLPTCSKGNSGTSLNGNSTVGQAYATLTRLGGGTGGAQNGSNTNIESSVRTSAQSKRCDNDKVMQNGSSPLQASTQRPDCENAASSTSSLQNMRDKKRKNDEGDAESDSSSKTTTSDSPVKLYHEYVFVGITDRATLHFFNPDAAELHQVFEDEDRRLIDTEEYAQSLINPDVTFFEFHNHAVLDEQMKRLKAAGFTKAAIVSCCPSIVATGMAEQMMTFLNGKRDRFRANC